MSIHILTCCLLVAGSILPTGGALDYDNSAEAWETLIDLEIAGRTLELYLENEPGAELPAEFTSLDELARGLPELYARRLSLRDGWGRKFFVGEVLDAGVILSKGENGLSEVMDGIEALSERYRDNINRPEELFGDDILFVFGDGVYNGPRSVGSRQKSTMADLRTVATAVEEYSIDNNSYPMQLAGLRRLESIQNHLSQSYMRRLPMNDAWGNPYLYWSDERSYVILSTGANGILDRAWDEYLPGDVDLPGECGDPNAEIVFGDGSFRQWPPMDKRR